jgi:hypothetical protein
MDLVRDGIKHDVAPVAMRDCQGTNTGLREEICASGGGLPEKSGKGYDHSREQRFIQRTAQEWLADATLLLPVLHR